MLAHALGDRRLCSPLCETPTLAYALLPTWLRRQRGCAKLRPDQLEPGGAGLALGAWTHMEGSLIGHYRVLRKLGEGGMGIVFEAVHEAIGRHVAIKILHPEYAKNAEFAVRFVNEARAVNRVDHPGIVQISDYGTLADGTAYIVMEYVRGETLRSRLERGGPPALTDTVALGQQLADTLAAAHAEGIVHRDLKPDNIMLTRNGRRDGSERTKLLDFGIAKLLEDNHDYIKTKTNVVMGTPAYMSPEQCRGASGVDHKSDVYSLGVILYLMLVGQPPFSGVGLGEILGRHMYEEPPALAPLVPTAPGDLVGLVHRMLHKEKQQRPSMGQVATVLEAIGKRCMGLPTISAEGHVPPACAPGTACAVAATQPEQRSTLGIYTGQAPWIPRQRLAVTIGGSLGVLILLGIGGRELRSKAPLAVHHGSASVETRHVVSGSPTQASEPLAGKSVESLNDEAAGGAISFAGQTRNADSESSSSAEVKTDAVGQAAGGRHSKAEKPTSQTPVIEQLLKEGNANLDAGALEAASNVFSVAVGLNARSCEAVGGLGKARFAQGNYELATRYLATAVSLCPRRSTANQELLIQAFYKLGRLADTAAACRKLLTQAPGSAIARQLLERVEHELPTGGGREDARQRPISGALTAPTHDGAMANGAAPKPAPVASPLPVPLTAQDHYDRGHYAEAVAAGLREARSGLSKSWALVGKAACKLHDGATATEAYQVATLEARSAIFITCSEAGFKLINHGFRLLGGSEP